MNERVKYLGAVSALGGRATTRQVAEFMGTHLPTVSARLGEAYQHGLLIRDLIPAVHRAGRHYVYGLSPTGARLLDVFTRAERWAAAADYDHSEDKQVIEQATAWGPDLGKLALFALGGLALYEVLKDDED